MVKISSPFFTMSPSWKATLVMVPVICDRRLMVVNASTLPMASMSTGTSLVETGPVTTGTPPPPPPPRPPPRAFCCGAAADVVSLHADEASVAARQKGMTSASEE